MTRQPDDSWAGTYDGTLAQSFQADRGQCRPERKGPDEFVFGGKGTHGGQPAQRKAVSRRAKK